MPLLNGDRDHLGSRVTNGATQKSYKAASSADSLTTSLQNVNVAPLWAQMARLNPELPNPRTKPFIWKYDAIRPYLLDSGRLIKEEQAERRVLMLVNPEREAPYTTDTLYAGLQLVMPRETAPAHRHSAFAVRFIIEGQGGFTAVHGRRVAMKPRDVLVTPPWNWHDHGKKGADEEGGDNNPVIWLDGLDLPNFLHFPVHFNEHYESSRYPAEDVLDSPILFSWSHMQPRLDEQSGNYARAPYLKADGRELGKTIGASAERLDAGTASTPIRETSSAVYHIIEGSGYSRVGEQTIAWQQGDTFCVPAWTKYQHFADTRDKVYFYRFDDKPMLRSLGLYRLDGADSESFVQD